MSLTVRFIKVLTRRLAGVKLNKTEAQAMGLVAMVLFAKMGAVRLAREVAIDLLPEILEKHVRELEAYENFRAMFGGEV